MHHPNENDLIRVRRVDDDDCTCTSELDWWVALVAGMFVGILGTLAFLNMIPG